MEFLLQRLTWFIFIQENITLIIVGTRKTSYNSLQDLRRIKIFKLVILSLEVYRQICIEIWQNEKLLLNFKNKQFNSCTWNWTYLIIVEHIVIMTLIYLYPRIKNIILW